MTERNLKLKIMHQIMKKGGKKVEVADIAKSLNRKYTSIWSSINGAKRGNWIKIDYRHWKDSSGMPHKTAQISLNPKQKAYIDMRIKKMLEQEEQKYEQTKNN